MTTTATSSPITRTLKAPGATLTYDVRRNDASTRTDPVPDRLADGRRRFRHARRPLRRPDRRHVRPARHRAQRPRRPGQRAHARRPRRRSAPDHPGGRWRPVDLFASSGGAVNALALVAKHPEDVRTLVAHEPPIATILPDREHALAAAEASATPTSAAAGAPAWRTSSPSSATSGPFTAEDAAQPGPDPAMFGMPAERRRLAHGRDAQPDRDPRHPLRARLRCPAGGLDADRARGRRGLRGHHGEPRRLRRRGAPRPRTRRASRATTAASSAASTARPASPTRSPRSCATSWAGAEPRRGQGRTRRGGTRPPRPWVPPRTIVVATRLPRAAIRPGRSPSASAASGRSTRGRR